MEFDKNSKDVIQGEKVMNVAELLSEVANAAVEKRAITNLEVLNEAYDYAKPSSFVRGMRLDLNGLVILLISGTASIDDKGETVHVGDFRAQCQRTFKNITGLLEAEGATWHDIVRTTCYMRDIDRDYAAFNEERTKFFQEQGLDPLPASTGIEANLCRPGAVLRSRRRLDRHRAGIDEGLRLVAGIARDYGAARGDRGHCGGRGSESDGALTVAA